MSFYEKYENLCHERGYKPLGKPMRELLGISPSTISSWKYGAIPRIETLRQIAEFFNVSSDYLLGLTEERNPQISFSANPESSSAEDKSAASGTSADSTLLASDPAKPVLDNPCSQGSSNPNEHSPGDLNADECFLIDLFRSLDPRGRARILQVAMTEEERQHGNPPS